MEKMLEMAILLDHYGRFLTPRQWEIMDYHCNHDYSLQEIAEHLKISRQGVHDGLKKAEKILLDMEEKLGLVRRYFSQKQRIKEVLHRLNHIKSMDLDKALLAQLDELEVWVQKIEF
jgi:uncharacterized protein